MAISNQSITLFRAENVVLNFTMSPVVDITGWTLAFTAAKALGTATKTIEQAGEVVNGPAGTFRVPLTTTDTDVRAMVYEYDVWRTDTGNETLLAIGDFTVSGIVRLPASA